MRVCAFLIDAPPKARVGGFSATFNYLAALAAEGHQVDLLLANRTKPFVHEGVHVTGAEWVWQYFDKADVVISNHGDDRRLHRLAANAHKPSIRFIHGAHDAFIFNLVEFGEPTLTVFNSHSLAAHTGYKGPQLVAHPILRPEEYATTPGDSITLVNLIKPKGVELFDQLARYLPHHTFLGVKGGYDEAHQVTMHRPNITTISKTRRMREDVYARTRILLMPSDYETWGLVGVEAFCSGIPVIAHPTPGLQESLGDAGLFCDRNDLHAWIDTIEMLNDPAVYEVQSQLCLQRAAQLAADDSLQRFIKIVDGISWRPTNGSDMAKKVKKLTKAERKALEQRRKAERKMKGRQQL